MWAKIDDGYLTNPKIMRLQPEAKLLHLASILYCCRELTDGEIPAQAVPMLAAMAGISGDVTQHVTALLTLGLWCDNGVTFSVRHFLDYNPGAASIKAKREATKVRQERWRQNQAERREIQQAQADPPPAPNAQRNGVTNSVHNDVINAAPVPVPVPHKTTTSEDVVVFAGNDKKSRATRLPKGWTPTPDDMAWATDKGYPAAFLDYETEKFTDYWASTGATKVDWSATWRNWQRKASEQIPAQRSGGTVRRGRDIGLTDEELELRARGAAW